jgi:hypothetical protein
MSAKINRGGAKSQRDLLLRRVTNRKGKKKRGRTLLRPLLRTDAPKHFDVYYGQLHNGCLKINVQQQRI